MVMSLYGSMYTETSLPIDIANEIGRRDRETAERGT